MLFISGCIILHSLAFAETERVENQAELFLKTLDKKVVIKSGTPHLLELLSDTSEKGLAFKNAYFNAARPLKSTYADSKAGHFRVHYDTKGKDAPDSTDTNKNGIPDYVDSTLVYLEFAYDKAIALGYGKPKSDGTLGGSSAIDCYIEELSDDSLYGYTSPDNSELMGMTSSYMSIDNNYTDTIYRTTDMDGLRITTAHEFFHVVQFSYFGGQGSGWWMEQSAVWFEDQTWDDINDYLNYTLYLFNDRNIPIDTYNGSFEYGASLFAVHIAERYGADMIRKIWSIFKDKQSGAIEEMNAVLPDGLEQTLSDFAVWLYFTGYRANSRDFFSEADIIKDTVKIERYIDHVPAEDSLSFSHYTFKYVEIIPVNGLATGDTLKCDSSYPDGGNWKRKVILYNDPYDYSVVQLDWQQPVIPMTRPFREAVLVVTNTSEKYGHYRFRFTIDRSTRQNVQENTIPQLFVLQQNYPNPFNPTTTITYAVPYTSTLTICVLNLQGQLVKTLADGTAYPGTYNLSFDGSGLPSGIYILMLDAGETRFTKKMTLLK